MDARRLVEAGQTARVVGAPVRVVGADVFLVLRRQLLDGRLDDPEAKRIVRGVCLCLCDNRQNHREFAPM